MEYSIAGYIFLGIILVGALIQTFHMFPTFFDKTFDLAASKITIAFLLILVSIVGLQFFLQNLKRWNRNEGFQTEEASLPTAMKQWNQLVEKYQISEVCDIKGRIQEKLFVLEKGVPPNTMTDDQAREQVEKIFAKGTSNGPVNCESFQKVNNAKDIDSFFTAVQELSDSFLIQVQETAETVKLLLEKQALTVADSLAKKEEQEGFVDTSVGICSPEIVEERRKFLRQKKLDEEAQSCLLPEEVPFDSKDTIAENKIKKIQQTYDAYIRMSPGKPTISELLTKSKEFEDTLNDQKEVAKQLSNAASV
jgi:hypothetical protein